MPASKMLAAIAALMTSVNAHALHGDEARLVASFRESGQTVLKTMIFSAMSYCQAEAQRILSISESIATATCSSANSIQVPEASRKLINSDAAITRASTSSPIHLLLPSPIHAKRSPQSKLKTTRHRILDQPLPFTME